MNFKRTLLATLAIASISMSSNASASAVGIFGYNSNSQIASFLNANGHVASQLSNLSSSSLTGLDALILLRAPGNSDLTNFIQSGGTLITEWDSATYGMSLLGGSASFVGYVGTSTPITFTSAGTSIGLSNSIGSSYSEGGATEFFYNIGSLGSATQYATRPGGATTIAGGAVGSGYAFINAYDWADSFSFAGPNSGRLILNELAFENSSGNAVPEPASLAMLGLGLVGLAAARRKSKTSSTKA